MAGIFGEFFLVSVSHQTKQRKLHKKFGAKFGAKFGTIIRKIRETFVLLQLFWLKVIRQNLKSVTVKITNNPTIHLIFKSVIPTRDRALFSRHAGTFVDKFARITDPIFRGI